ncbi:MAG: D-tyrosyl-tRNA(Tyr) deacylase [Candidatus Mcinerneyibacterium aminivorans]|uniref:D-aminoacyl-tRNA deacylase n=1 Tax=Candidatus Mcinerneyibacterium aminivorans TaxID=2703815 RepID=A0A5D0MJT6_9BACT|nr:MAG: D-tyrosyl-tRNA(Tyr) deacylase [Candidatus Mcinerneyibacterium aminivorans]
MKALIQRVKEAEVSVNNEKKGSIGKGLLVFLSVGEKDTKKDAEFLYYKLRNLRIFEDENGKMNYSIEDIGGNMLLISQFTLHADTRKGHRPSFNNAAGPKRAKRLYKYMINYAKSHGMENIQTGVFGAYMSVKLENDGPVTIILESKNEQ